eukprot:5443848-Pyramimonas_sp.AAC.1
MLEHSVRNVMINDLVTVFVRTNRQLLEESVGSNCSSARTAKTVVVARGQFRTSILSRRSLCACTDQRKNLRTAVVTGSTRRTASSTTATSCGANGGHVSRSIVRLRYRVLACGGQRRISACRLAKKPPTYRLRNRTST